MEHEVSFHAKPESNVSVDAKVKRGPESWTFIYIALGFALTIESTIVAMITPVSFPFNVVAYAAIAAVTFWLFIENGSFQNWLIENKSKYENKLR